MLLKRICQFCGVETQEVVIGFWFGPHCLQDPSSSTQDRAHPPALEAQSPKHYQGVAGCSNVIREDNVGYSLIVDDLLCQAKQLKLMFHAENDESLQPILLIYLADCQRIDALELWCWRRLLRVPWTARRQNQSILKEINPEYSLKGLILKLQYFGHLMQRTD